MSQINCHHCQRELHGRDVDFSTGEPLCRFCGGVVCTERQSSLPRTDRKPVKIPTSIQVIDDQNGSITIRVPWRLQGAQALTQLVFFCSIGLVAFVGHQSGLRTWVILLLIALLAGLFYTVRLINSTRMKLTQGLIALSHGPFPWLSRRIQGQSIEQIYVDRRILAQKKFDYSVRAKLKEAEPLVIFQSLSDPAVALYLEQCIESQLEIVDRPVSGEFQLDHLQQLAMMTDTQSMPKVTPPPQPPPQQ